MPGGVGRGQAAEKAACGVKRSPAPPDPEPTPAEQNRRLAIARSVWPGFDYLHDTAAKLVQVDEALAHVASPSLSQHDREAIEAAAKEIP